MKDFIIGIDKWTKELLTFRSEEAAAVVCNTWKVIEADNAFEAKEIFTELYCEGDIDNKEE